MGYRLVALDVDGTIRTADRAPSDRTRKAIARVTEAGARVTLATGRMFRSALAGTAGLGLTSPIVSFQGAHIADPTTGDLLWHRPLTPEMAVGALDSLAGWKSEVLLYLGHDVYANMDTPWVEAYGRRNRGGLNVVDNLRTLAAKEPTRLVAVGKEEEVQALEQRLRSHFDSTLHVTRSMPYFCEILHPGAGKRNALAWLCRHLGISEDRTVAFGNGYNDVEMLAWAGLGVAIAGAPPELLEVADRVAPPVEEDGAAQVLEELLGRGLFG